MGKDKRQKSKKKLQKSSSSTSSSSSSEDSSSEHGMAIEPMNLRVIEVVGGDENGESPFTDVAEEKLNVAEATVRRVRGNVKKRKYIEKSAKIDQDSLVPKVDEKRLFLGNISPAVTKDDMEDFFNTVGQVQDFTVIVRANQKGKVPNSAYAFVTLDSKEAAGKAIEKLNTTTMITYPGHTVIVKPAAPKQKRNKKRKLSHEEKKVEKKVEKAEKKLEKAERKIVKADRKVEKAEKKIEKDEKTQKVEKAEKKVEKALEKVDKAIHKAEKAEWKVEKKVHKATKKSRK